MVVAGGVGGIPELDVLCVWLGMVGEVCVCYFDEYREVDEALVDEGMIHGDFLVVDPSSWPDIRSKRYVDSVIVLDVGEVVPRMDTH